ncbi:hypothetical protein [Ancylobacter polymorphus]|uniref:Uncharacterized protein n=1 Tax=Ancylobacter polymorphus TaxID=223390 RepID=A0A9E6ZTX6_9HYPH|nr:hypothetical protein [Ancylobacter polymorphus]UOK71669.1 hypothetical protein K9D25_02800 [Ancylobacter polymorphus]
MIPANDNARASHANAVPHATATQHATAPSHTATPYATYTAPGGIRHRVRIVSTTKAGRLGITENLGDASSPQRYVSTRELSQFLPTPYPVRAGETAPASITPLAAIRRANRDGRVEAAHRIAAMVAALNEDSSDIAGCVCSALGITRLDLIGDSRIGLLIQARRVIVASTFVRERGVTLHKLGEAAGCHYSTAKYHLQAAGISRRTVSEFDVPFMRALWRRGFARLGGEPGQMPPEVAARVSAFIHVIGPGAVEPKAINDLRRYLAEKIARERLDLQGETKCAA